MEPYQAFTQDIRDGPEGDGVGAFFDLDGTIIATHSVMDIFKERLFTGQVSSAEVFDLVNMAVQYALKTGSFEDAMASSIRNIEGQSEQQFRDLGEKVFLERLAPVIFPEVKAMIREHQAQGHTLAIITSATRFQAEALANYLGIDHILCTELEVKDGLFTGKLAGDTCYGAGKVRAAQQFADEMGIDLENCYFYSNGSEDVPLLEAVGYPVAISPDKELLKQAAWNDWPAHQLQSRGSTGVRDMARSLMTFSSVLPALVAGLPFRLLGGSTRDATNFSISAWSGIASMISGLKLIVEGEEHLWSHRPAVFIFNHQSAMDMVIAARLLRQDIVAIAKQEIKKQPIMGPALMYAGAVFIDRESSKNPIEVLRPAIEALHEGRSVVMAPEGTRSKDEKLGKFRKGAFHLAMQAQVPIVPIVIHNALDAMPNNSKVVWPAEVKVTVMKPISTQNWTLRSVIKSCRSVRQDYLDILQQTDEGSK